MSCIGRAFLPQRPCALPYRMVNPCAPQHRLAGRIQKTYDITKDQAEQQVKAFEQLHKDYQP